jgi:hypothetical protein
MGWGLRDAVGLTNAGTQSPNHAIDQQQVGELLDGVARLPIEIPGIPHEGTLIENLPPIEDGLATPELCEAIRRFQAGEGDLIADSRVDVNGATWNRLMSLVQPGMEPPGPVPLLLSVHELEIIELPTSASGLPAVTYSIQGNPVAVFSGPGITIELSVQGPIKVSWTGAYPIACVTSPDFAALEAAVASGAARAIGASALNNLCSQLQLESKASVGSLFASVRLAVGFDGSLMMTGSLGNDFTATSLSFDPIERAIIYDGDIKVLETRPVTGGDATLTGKLRARVKIKSQDNDFEASLATAIAVTAAGAVFLSPVIVGLGIEASVPAISEGVKDVMIAVVRVLAF